ncbi:MAG: TraU family protein [Archaeoglobaceae archaeon]
MDFSLNIKSFKDFKSLKNFENFKGFKTLRIYFSGVLVEMKGDQKRLMKIIDVYRVLFFILWFLVFLGVFISSEREAVSGDTAYCKGSFINPITDINWWGVFPIEIAGVQIAPGYDDPASAGLSNPPSKLGQVVCMCKEPHGRIRLGVAVSFFTPARLVETTKNPFCFPALGGITLGGGGSGYVWKHKTPTRAFSTGKGAVNIGNYNVHYFFYDLLTVIGIFLDLPCPPKEGFDLVMVSEVDPTWESDLLAMVESPEAIVFANLPANLACAADSIASTVGYPLDALFWCVGSWGISYPMSQESLVISSSQSSALMMTKMLYKNARRALYLDPGVDVCNLVYTPVLIKSHNKVHLVAPVKGPLISLGRTTLLWDYLKNPPLGTSKSGNDDYVWVLFRRVKCCFGPAF